MIGTTGAFVLFIINIILAGMLGIVAGGLTCLVLRQPWNLRAVLQDALLAAGVALLAAYFLATIETARGVCGSLVGPVLAIAAASVLLRRILGFVLLIAR